MSHRKRRETKQQSSMLPGPAVPGCSLVSFRFLCDIHSIHSGQGHRAEKNFVCDINRGIRNPGVRQCLGFYSADS